MHKIIDNLLINHSNGAHTNGNCERKKISSITDYNTISNTNNNRNYCHQQQLMINEQLFQKMLTICIDHFKSQSSSSYNNQAQSSQLTTKTIDPNEIDQFIQSYYATNNFNAFLINSARSRSPNQFTFSKVNLSNFVDSKIF
jgi:hypothetical protein